MTPGLTKAFGSVVAEGIISNYLIRRGTRYELISKICKIFNKHIGLPIGITELSRIISSSQTIAALFNHDSLTRDTFSLFKLEYLINRLVPNRRFNPTLDELWAIQFESTKLIREVLIKGGDINRYISPTVFNMFWDSLYALSDAQGNAPFPISEVSRVISHDINHKIFYKGKPPSGNIAKRLKLYLIFQGVHQNDLSIQWIDAYLSSKESKVLPIDEYIKVLNKPLSAISGSASDSTLSSSQKKLAGDILWAMSCGRSWMSGKKIVRGDVLVHHITHEKDPNSPNYGKTLYGGFYDSIRNLAPVKGPSENRVAEGVDKWRIEAELIEAYVSLLNGDPPSHWDLQDQIDFTKERRSRIYITDYARTVPNIQV